MGTQSPSTALNVARSGTSYAARVEGRGTMQVSPALIEFAGRASEGSKDAKLFVDLSVCDYLDSTFLGCLMALHKRFNGGGRGPVRFEVIATPAKAKQLLGPTKLDRVLPTIETLPLNVAEWVPLASGAIDARKLSEHVMECHRRLAEVDGPGKGTFAKIADGIERDLQSRKTSS